MKKISELTNATIPFVGTELFPVVQESETRKATIDDVVKTVSIPEALIGGMMDVNIASPKSFLSLGTITQNVTLTMIIDLAFPIGAEILITAQADGSARTVFFSGAISNDLVIPANETGVITLFWTGVTFLQSTEAITIP